MKLRVVVLDNAWESWNDPTVRDLFAKVVTLKHDGYGKEYPSNVLPVDTADFFGTHHMVCEDRDGELVPLMAYKSVALSRVRRFSGVFGAINLVRVESAAIHEQAISEILEAATSSGRDISYDSSWTICPGARNDEGLTRKLREIMKAIHTIYHTDGAVPEVIAGAVVKFGMEALYQYWGYKRLALDGKAMPALKLRAYGNEPVSLWHAERFSDLAIQEAAKFRALWDSRLVIGKRDELEKEAA